MTATPFFGPSYISRSTNLADQHCTNLFPEVVEDKTGKDIGALYLTPGLTRFSVAGSAAIRAMRSLGNSPLYVVSGNELYTMTTGGVATLVGTIGTSSGPLSMINNGTQLAIFDSTGGYLVPGGFPLTGGTIASAGTNYRVGDTILLRKIDATQTGTAMLTVLTVTATGGVATFAVTYTGAFPTSPSGFAQARTSGAGTGFTLTLPTYGGSVPIYTIPLPFTPSGQIPATYLDGYGVAAETAKNILWQSDLLDLSIWDALNFGSATADPDMIVNLVQVHRDIFVVKQAHTEVWNNAGTAGFVFERSNSVYIEAGLMARNSLATVGESIMWLAQSQSGKGVVVQVQGYNPKRVSTFAIEEAIRGYSDATDAIGYSFQYAGHQCYVLTFPTGNATWVYDATVSALLGIPIWYELLAWDGTNFNRHYSNCGVFFAGLNLVGDYRANGRIYNFDGTNFTDDGVSRKLLRSWRAVAQPSDDPRRFNGLRIDMQTGVSITGTPTCSLRWSDDGGHTWSTPLTASVGNNAQTAVRVMFRRLGSTRRNSGLDRIFEWSAVLSSGTSFPAALLGGELQE